MAEYQCICCRETKESEKSCTCPNCGYKMYPTPYERKQVLADEINSFVNHLKLDAIKPSEIIFFRKEPLPPKSEDDSEKQKFKTILKSEDDKRFPTFDTIQSYVCAGKKLEDFFTRLNKSLEELKNHIHEEYQKSYEANFDSLKSHIAGMDSALKEALKEIGMEAELPEPECPQLVLDYREMPNEELIDIAGEMMAMLNRLSDKIKRFIKANNIYGIGYQKKLKPALKQSKDNNYAKDLEDIRAAVGKVLAKKYTVDIFLDGSQELEIGRAHV